MSNNSENKTQTATLELMDFSLEELKIKVKEELDNPWFTNFYIYKIEGISMMLYHTLWNKDVIKILITRSGNDDYFGLGYQVGLEMTTHKGVDDFGHSGYSMTQTVFVTQQIIIKGLNGVVEFYKNKKPKHPLV